MTDLDAIKAGLRKKKKKRPVLRDQDLLSFGSTQANLSITGRACGGIPKGKYVFIVGDSDSGKTVLLYTIFAEASINSNFKDYRLIHDNPENSTLDVRKLFGDALAKRLEPPAGTREDWRNSEYVEDFFYNLDDAIKDGRPFIYILDSIDAIDAEAAEKFFDGKKKQKRKEKRVGDEETAGTYGLDKPKIISRNLNRVTRQLKANGSILIIVNQTRDNIGFGAKFAPKTRAGGRALRFYARIEIWSSSAGKLTKSVRGKHREIGILSKWDIKKNHITGRKGSFSFPIYHSHGIDDVGSCVDYLVEEKYWKVTGGKVSAKGTITGKIVAEDFGFTGPREKLVEFIEENNYQEDLGKIVQDLWNEILAASKVKRKNKYSGD